MCYRVVEYADSYAREIGAFDHFSEDFDVVAYLLVGKLFLKQYSY
jgi:hypothetical protein